MDGNLLVERIRLLCRQNGTSLTKLETHLGFGNGAIGKWRRNKPPYERLQKVASYFGVTVAELTGEEQKETHALPQENELDSVEKVKALCKERKIPISRLEKELGYANGYIGQLRKGTFPNDRLVEIANYLNVPTAYLTGEGQKEKPAFPKENELTDMQQKAFDMIKQMTDDQLKAFIAAAEAFLR